MQHGECITALLDEGTNCTDLSVCTLPGILQPYARQPDSLVRHGWREICKQMKLATHRLAAGYCQLIGYF